MRVECQKKSSFSFFKFLFLRWILVVALCINKIGMNEWMDENTLSSFLASVWMMLVGIGSWMFCRVSVIQNWAFLKEMFENLLVWNFMRLLYDCFYGNSTCICVLFEGLKPQKCKISFVLNNVVLNEFYSKFLTWRNCS